MSSFCACASFLHKTQISNQQIRAASPPFLSIFTYDVSRQTRFPRYPVVSRDTLKEGTEVELVCGESRASHSHLHQWSGQSQRVRVKMIKPVPSSAMSYELLKSQNLIEFRNQTNSSIFASAILRSAIITNAKDMTSSIQLPSPHLSFLHLWLLQQKQRSQ